MEQKSERAYREGNVHQYALVQLLPHSMVLFL